VSALSPLDPAAHLVQAGARIMIEAIAGDPYRAREMATNFITEVDRWSDAAWHGELVVLLGVSRLRSGDADVALSYFTAARRSTMAIPFWYRSSTASRRWRLRQWAQEVGRRHRSYC